MSVDATTLVLAKKYTDSKAISQGNVPGGGTTGQALTKLSNTDLDIGWQDSSGGVTQEYVDNAITTEATARTSGDAANSNALSTFEARRDNPH